MLRVCAALKRRIYIFVDTEQDCYYHHEDMAPLSDNLFDFSDELSSPLIAIICQIDAHYPGALCAFIQTTHYRRHVIASALARAMLNVSEKDLPEIKPIRGYGRYQNEKETFSILGERLLHGRSSAVLHAAFGSLPSGYRGALRRCSPTIASPRFYLELFNVFSDPQNRSLARALHYETDITYRKLAFGLKLPPVFCRPGIFDMVQHVSAEDFLTAVAVIQKHCDTASDAALAASLPKVTDRRVFSNWVARWIARARLPQQPIHDDDVLRPLKTVLEMHRLGRRMQNCLSSKVVAALAGETSYVASDIDGITYVTELVRGSAGWRVEEVFGKGNLCVAVAAEDAILARFRKYGIETRNPVARDPCWRAIERALRHATLPALEGAFEDFE